MIENFHDKIETLGWSFVLAELARRHKRSATEGGDSPADEIIRALNEITGAEVGAVLLNFRDVLAFWQRKTDTTTA